jgi:integrase/recombinase XerD
VNESPLERAVRGYLDHLAVERGLAANSLASYRRDLRRYAAFLDERGIAEPPAIGEEDVSAFLRSLREGDAEHQALGASSAARAVVAVRGLHRFLHREGLSAVDPAGGVRPPTPPRRLPKAISLEQVETLLTAASADGAPLALRDRALLEVLYGTGARISEAVGLDRDDLDLQGGTVLLRGKGGKHRLVPVGRAHGRCCGPWRAVHIWPRTSRRTRFGIRSPLICSTGAPTSAWYRSYSVTPQ